MAQLNDQEILAKVKTALGITGDFNDATLSEYIAEAKSFMIQSGVSQAKTQSAEAAGLIARLVSDLWSYGPGSVKLSEYTAQRLTQLAVAPDKEGEANA